LGLIRVEFSTGRVNKKGAIRSGLKHLLSRS
jgi:hypothetical protein